MPATPPPREIEADSGGVRLAGSVWMPADGADAGVLMHPGSGPSDRDNDVFFPPIREHLLAAGIAVCSFDKRGVGGSSGRWQDAGIAEQADDLGAALAAFRAASPSGLPLGLFGHSQGGWVVVEAAGRGIPVAFVVTSSGGAVTPARQERYSLARRLARDGVAEADAAEALAAFDAVMTVARGRTSLDRGLERLDATGLEYRVLGELNVMFEDETVWRLVSDINDYDPAQALARIAVPLLALFGSSDEITPPEESVAALRETVRPDLLQIEVFPTGDHRLKHGEPPRFVDGYLDRLAAFIRSAAAASTERL
ncbi:MAG: alpha/beta hydrolase family protein [Gaiellaceae bacterium]